MSYLRRERQHSTPRLVHITRAMQPFRIFQPSGISTDCDRCGGRVDLLKGGVCTRCRRILCYTHLHGSWLRRLMADLRNESVCVECRSGRRVTTGAPVDAHAR